MPFSPAQETSIPFRTEGLNFSGSEKAICCPKWSLASAMSKASSALSRNPPEKRSSETLPNTARNSSSLKMARFCSSNSEKIAEDKQYIIRHYVTASLFDDYNEKRVYKKQGIIEKYIGSFDGGDVTPHKRYEIYSFQVDESKNVFIGHCHSLLNAKDSIMSFPIVKSNN